MAVAPAMANTLGKNTVEVRIQVYELTADNGTARVYNKLSSKATRSCATQGRPTLSTKRQNKACAVSLLDQFVRDLNNQAVSDYHQRATSQ